MDWINMIVEELLLGLLGKGWRIAAGGSLGIVVGVLVAFHFGMGWGLAVLIICMGLGLIWQRSVPQD